MLNFIKSIFEEDPLDRYLRRAAERINFETCIDSYIINAWRDGVINHKKLSTYDRYLLEFKFLEVNKDSRFGLHYNITIYNQDLDIVYDAHYKEFKALNSSKINSKEQMLLELEYWLSLDWEIGDEQGDK